MNAPLLRLLPAALLLWVLPATFGAWRLIVGFQEVAEKRAAGTGAVAVRLATEAAGLIWLGSAVLLVAILALAVWQRRVEREHIADAARSVSAPWQRIVLSLAALTVLPAALVVYSTYSATELTVRGALAMDAARATGARPDIDLRALTTAVTYRLVLGVTLGLLTAGGLVGFQLLNLFAIRPSAGTRFLPRAQWVIAAVVLACATGAFAVLSFHLGRLSGID